MSPNTKNSHVMDCENCPFRSMRIFCSLSPPAFKMFQSIGTNSNVNRGTILFRENESCENTTILCTGLAKLFCTSKSGKVQILKIARPGDLLGLSAMMSGSRHEATAEIIEPAQIKIIRKAELTTLFELHGQSGLHASRALSTESNRALLDIRRMALAGSVAGRVAGVLIDWERSTYAQEPGGCFPMPLTHEELAALAATSRETVTRTLRHFQDEGLIQISGYAFRILLPQDLQAMLD